MEPDVESKGHYARKDWAGSRPRLLRAVDPLKDQSYYLSSIPETGLARALFPLGNLTKAEVRRIAQDGGVPTSILERKESMGLCFIGQKKRTDFKEFIGMIFSLSCFHILSTLISTVSYLGTSPGPVKDLSTGQTLMKHRGLWQFTIGENLRLGGLREKMYVAQKDIPSNTIFVAPTRFHLFNSQHLCRP
jgi:tRNA-specific 2-thiouridylase